MSRGRRKNLRALCLVGVMALPGVASAEPPGERVHPTIDPVVRGFFELGMTPGLAVAVVEGEEVVYARGFGVTDVESPLPVTPETPFYIASTTKSFTGTAAAVLAQRGDIDLDEPISETFTDLELAPPLSPEEISLRDLLTLTHGISTGGPIVFRTAYSGEHSPELLLRLLATYPPAENGRAFEYGNLGFNVAALVLEARTGRRWQEVVETEVLAPAGMAATRASVAGLEGRMAAPHDPAVEGFRRIPFLKGDASLHAAGGHVSTALDLARWVEVQLNEGRLDGRSVLPAEAIAETQRHQVDQDNEAGPYHRDGWGLGWDLATYRGHRLLSRFGGFAGYRSHVSFMPDERLGVVVLVNDGTLGSMLADRLANAIYDERLDGASAAVDREANLAAIAERVAQGRAHFGAEMERRMSRSQKLPYPRSAYVGVFENPEYGVMHWTLDGEALSVSIGLAHSAVEVYDGEANQLRVELTGRGEVVTFAFEDGRATALDYAGRTFTPLD